MEGKNICTAIAGIEYLTIELRCKKCGELIEGSYHRSSQAGVRRCANRNCPSFNPNVPQWFDDRSPEFETMEALKEALRKAAALVADARKKEGFALEIRVALQHKGPYKMYGK